MSDAGDVSRSKAGSDLEEFDSDYIGASSSFAVDLSEAGAASLELLQVVEGYGRVIVIDALLVSDPTPGRIREIPLESLSVSPTVTAAHGIGIKEALDIGATVGMSLPSEVHVYGIEVLDPYSFDSQPTPEVTAEIESAVREIGMREFGREL